MYVICLSNTHILSYLLTKLHMRTTTHAFSKGYYYPLPFIIIGIHNVNRTKSELHHTYRSYIILFINQNITQITYYNKILLPCPVMSLYKYDTVYVVFRKAVFKVQHANIMCCLVRETNIEFRAFFLSFSFPFGWYMHAKRTPLLLRLCNKKERMYWIFFFC